MRGLRKTSRCIGALLCAALLLVPVALPASTTAGGAGERELRFEEWSRRGQLRLQAWRTAWLKGDVQQRWMALAMQGGRLDQAATTRQIRELAGQPVGQAYVARVAMSAVQQHEGLPVAEREAILKQLRAEIETLDADNAITWVEALPDPRAVSPETLRQARALLQKMADSPRVDTAGFVPLIRYFAAAPAEPLTRSDAMMVAGMLSAISTPAFQSLMHWCRQQPELRDVCQAAALHLTTKSDTLLTRNIGFAVLDRVVAELGTRAQVAVWRAESDALSERVKIMAPDPAEADEAALDAFAERWFHAYAEPGATEMRVIEALTASPSATTK